VRAKLIARLIMLASAVSALALPPAAYAQVQVNQVFNSQGPGPAVGPRNPVGSGDNPPNGTVAGAVQAIATDPVDPNTYYLGAPQGGVWVTHNGGTSWTPLTDNQASTSIASLALDPTDPAHKTLIAGIGLTANGTLCDAGACFFTASGGLRTGLLYSTNGGTSWSSLGAGTFGGQTVDAVVANGNVLLAGTFEPSFASSATQRTVGGLYRTTNSGGTFSLVSGAAGTGLPAGPISSLATDPANANRFYAAVGSPDLTAAGQNSTAVYVSNDRGATWSAVFATGQAGGTINGATQTVIKVATGPSGTLAAAVINLNTGKLSGLFYSSNGGAAWTTLPTPPTNGGAQAPVNLAVAIDPNNTNFVYVSGDNNFSTNGGINAVSAFRVSVSGLSFTGLGDDNGVPANTANGSTVHPDSRALAFDASGRLLLSSDGGIYARTNPQNNTGVFQSINGNLSVFQPYAVGLDANSKRLVVAAQDNGASIQSAPGSALFNQLIAGDGVNAAVNDRTFAGQSLFYTTSQGLGQKNKKVLDANGNTVSPGAGPAGVPITFNVGVVGNNFFSQFVLNKADPTRIAVTGSHVYVTQDTSAVNAASVALNLTDLGNAGASLSTVAYGTRDNNNVLVAGSTASALWLSTTALAGSLVPVAAYGGLTPTSIVFDPRSQNRFYVADNANVFGTQTQGLAFTTLTGNLPATLVNPTALEFISNNGVNALLVGGQSNAANAQSTVAVADSDTLGNLSGWRPFGSGLPNTTVGQLVYNPTIDALAVGTFGRGVYVLYDVTSYFPQATVLQFGLANNDSQPDASFLNNGTVGNRPLIKYGSGTLTVAGNATYTGGTTIENGILQLGNGGAAGSILGNVTFCSSGADPLCNTTNSKSLAFNRSDIYTFGGSITGPGQVAQMGTGLTILTGTSTYSGPTTVFGGILRVQGSITSPVTVNAGGALGGSGSVGSTTILAGGTLAPGDPQTLTVNGNLVFNPGANYVITVLGNTSDRTNVTGTATLAGNVTAINLGGVLANNYVILSAAGGRTGTFNTLTLAGFPGLAASLVYTPTEVDLRFSSAIANVAGLTPNQRAVAGALDFSFNNGGGTLLGLLGLAASQLPAALDNLSGEGTSGTQETTFGASNMFLSMMMDQGQFWRSGDPFDPIGTTLGPHPHAPVYKKAMPVKAPVVDLPRWRAWATGSDATWKLNGDPAIGSADLSHRTAGGAAGLDYQINPNLLLGMAGGASSSQFSVPGRATSGNIDGVHLGGYGVARYNQYYAAGALTFGTFQDSTSRTISGIGATETATGSFSSYLLGGRFEAGWEQRFGNFAVTPFAAVQVSDIWQPGFAERSTAATGAPGVLALVYQSKNIVSVPTFVGAQFDTRVTVSDRMVWSPYARLSWVHEFDPTRNITATFATLPLATFTVDGARPARDAGRVDVGSKLSIAKNTWLFSSFVGEFSNISQMYAGKGGLRISW
jgi:autotransporter-associated beta strand protein